MKKYTFPLLLLISWNTLLAQNTYFQQEVNYTIEVTLNDQDHTLSGTIEMEYVNHSPNELDLIYMHLWGNAFKNRKTAFANQKIREGSTTFYFSNQEDMGGYSDLNFTVNDKTIAWDLQKDNPDIATLKLNEGLKSGASIRIKTPFKLKIPASFSRLGHVGESYQMTQWYPKPAVYDHNGWHPMPYLDMGEFYSEFGAFDVQITLPENYVVAATGVLQTESEHAFLNEKIEETSTFLDSVANVDIIIPKKNKHNFPRSSPNLKTIQYTAQKVHDFAWFADKRFYVQKSEVQLSTGEKVDTWAFFTKEEASLWKKGTDYLNRSVKFYSDLVGAYPYPHATAVQSALSAGAGMEYPMITVIGQSGDAQTLDWVITHEVGHNWFYGILGSNERDHAWMDEGLNSYYDHRYIKLHYEEELYRIIPSFFQAGSSIQLEELGYLYQARRHQDQAPDIHSNEFSETNYYLSSYEKPAFAFKMLEKYLGTNSFDEVMQAYYKEWQFKHPQPTDLKNHLEQASGKKLSWLFEDFLESNRTLDYALKTAEERGDAIKIKVANKGEINAPFSISAIKDDKIVSTKWFEGFDKEKTFDFPKGTYDRYVLDAENVILDINRKNNTLKTSGLFKTLEPLQFKLLAGIENPKRTSLYWLPTIGWNHYDEMMLGLVLHNRTLPIKKFEFSLAPAYALASKDIVGLGNVLYHLYPTSSFLQKITFDVGWKSFNYIYNERDDYHLKYTKLQPSITVNFKTAPNSSKESYLSFRTLLLFDELAQRSQDSLSFGDYIGNEVEQSTLFELSYVLENKRALNPYRLRLALEQQSYENIRGDQNYLKAAVDWKSAYTYKENRHVNFRIYAAGFLVNTQRNAGNVANRSQRGSIALSSEGFNDYKYDYLHFARNETAGFFSRQIGLEQGGMKYAFGSSQRNLGYSNSFVVALNFKADLPKELPLNFPLKPYFDIGYFDNAQPLGSNDEFSDQLIWSGGLMLDFFDGMFGLYFPIINSNNLKLQFNQLGNPDDSPLKRYLNRITFSIDIQRANPFRLIHKIKL